jgi:hypothetical protein
MCDIVGDEASDISRSTSQGPQYRAVRTIENARIFSLPPALENQFLLAAPQPSLWALDGLPRWYGRRMP